MRSSIRAASGPEQGVGSLPLHALVSLQSRGWAPFPPCPGLPPSPPPQRRGDLTHCLSLSLPQSQASRRARAPHSPTGSLLAASRDWALFSAASFSAKGPEWKVNLHWSACCCVHGPEPQTFLGDISARKGPRKSKALTQESQTHKPLQLLRGHSRFCLPTYTCAVPPKWA